MNYTSQIGDSGLNWCKAAKEGGEGKPNGLDG